MSQTKGRIARIFMFIVGLILFLAGLFMVYAERESLKDAFINNMAFFLSGGILIYLGLTWKKNKE
jgi:uncharacterized membrane protein